MPTHAPKPDSGSQRLPTQGGARSLLAVLCLLAGSLGAVPVDPLAWPEPTCEQRPGCFWWWMGSGVDEPNLTANLEALREAGMGGVTVVPIYGVRGDESRDVPFLSERWVQLLDYTVREAERLDLWVDLTPGTGWPLGGPGVSEADADARVSLDGGVFRTRFSGMKVKRAAPGGEGRVLNPYDPAAMSRYLETLDRALDGRGLHWPRALYHDSFEYRGDGCADLPEAFLRLRGYDLRKHLDALAGEGDPDTVARVKADYRRTLSDRHLEFVRTWVTWSEGHGCTTRNQAHGAPANLLDLYAVAGIPETETFGATSFAIPGIRREPGNVRTDQPQPLINRMASSAAHVTGKPRVASETCTWLRNHFRAALSQVRPEIDQLFLAGINHVIFHGSCYSPQDAPWPGWLFYASLEYNPRNSIWHDAPFLNTYITRCQSLLQSGRPDNDVALYWPVEDLWHRPEGLRLSFTVHDPTWLTDTPCGRTAQWLLDHGYAFDFISDRQLEAGLDRPYRVLLMPRTVHLPVATARRLVQRAEEGRAVVVREALPGDVPGWYRAAERRGVLREHFAGWGGRVCDDTDLGPCLDAAGARREPLVDAGLSYLRRRIAGGHLYFVANQGPRAVDRWIRLSGPCRGAVLLDPDTGGVGVVPTRGGRDVYLQLAPGETRLLRTTDARVASAPAWPVYRAEPAGTRTLSGPWRVRFLEGGPVRPAPFTTDTLGSWTERGGEAARFAGTARYETTVTLPPLAAAAWRLDLGDVRESARVFVDGRRAGVRYSLPFVVTLTGLGPGVHTLAVEVTNLAANRIRDLDRRGVDWKRFHDINFVTHDYKTFDASTWPLTPSGLLGPLRLVPLQRITP